MWCVFINFLFLKQKKTQENGDEQVLFDARRVAGEDPNKSEYMPKDAREFCGRLFHTCYMGTTNSSTDTRERAKTLANEIGSYHIDCNIDTLVSAMVKTFEVITGKIPKFKAHGGTHNQNLALQNIQVLLM